MLLLASAAAAPKGFHAFDTLIVCSSAMHVCIKPGKDARCLRVSGMLRLSKLLFAQERFKHKETQGTRDSWKSRAESAVRWVSLRNGTLAGKQRPGQLQYRGSALLTRPRESFQAKGTVFLLRKRKKGDIKHLQLPLSADDSCCCPLRSRTSSLTPLLACSSYKPALTHRFSQVNQTLWLSPASLGAHQQGLLSVGNLGFSCLSLQSTWSYPSYVPC